MFERWKEEIKNAAEFSQKRCPRKNSRFFLCFRRHAPPLVTWGHSIRLLPCSWHLHKDVQRASEECDRRRERKELGTCIGLRKIVSPNNIANVLWILSLSTTLSHSIFHTIVYVCLRLLSFRMMTKQLPTNLHIWPIKPSNTLIIRSKANYTPPKVLFSWKHLVPAVSPSVRSRFCAKAPLSRLSRSWELRWKRTWICRTIASQDCPGTMLTAR